MAQLVQPVQVAGIPNQFVSTSLYVGDLEPLVSESHLYELFNQIGQVVSIRVCRDLMTRRSLGYAYVNYSNVQDASRALEHLNFSVLNGKPVRIMFSHRDPSIRKSGTANIFIKNLDRTIDNKALYDTFANFGNILSCKVATDSTGQSKGYGFVQFEQEEAAQLAIDKVNGMQLVDKQVFVGPFVRRQERELSTGVTKFNNVFIKNLSEKATDDDLKTAFGAFGKITSAVVMRDAEGKSRCFGFVNFESAEEAAKAVEALNGKKIDDKEWYVGRAQKKSEREAELRAKYELEKKERVDKYQGSNLYLKNLDDDMDDEKLREIFSEYGNIVSSKVMREINGQSKGSGFVAFATPEEANRAANDMNGKMVGSKPIYVAMAQRKEERRQKMQNQFALRNPVGIGAGVATSMPMYHPGPGLGQQLFYGQPPALMPPQPTGFGYQQQMLGMRPGGGQLPNYFVPVVRQGPQGAQRAAGTRRTAAPVPQQQLPPPQQQQQQQPQMIRGGNRSFRYTPTARNTPDVPVPPQGLMNVMPVPLDMAGVPLTPGSGLPPSMGIGALASALAAAPPEQQRVMLGEQLYPLVDQLEHDHAGKVTGMLLEMDQTEILHLLESPEALKAKVGEAMEVLRVSQRSSGAAEQLASLSLNDPIAP